MNVALYGRGAARWAMTERGAASVQRDVAHLAIGPSAMTWDGNALMIQLDERATPIPWPVRGTVRVIPQALSAQAFTLDPGGRHLWQPVATRARIEVAMAEPGVSWRGDGYFDHNRGAEPLEQGFRNWNWSRAHRRDDTAVLYEGVRKDGSPFNLALQVDRHGEAHAVEPPPPARLPPTTIWRMPRATRADHGSAPRIQRTWEDTPFYSRSAIATRLWGEPCAGVHESLSLTRLDTRIVRGMLPYRMPRRP